MSAVVDSLPSSMDRRAEVGGDPRRLVGDGHRQGDPAAGW
jgi:hypothetical protein